MAKSTQITLVVHDGVCSDDITRAASIQVEGPNGSFDWMGGEQEMRATMAFLHLLRQVDHRVAGSLSTHTPERVAP